MSRFAEVGVALLDPFKPTTTAKLGSSTVFSGGKLPTPSNPWSGGQIPGGIKPSGGLTYTFGVLKPPTLPKPPAIQPPAPKPPPVIAVLPKPPAIVPPATVTPVLSLPVTPIQAGTFSVAPSQGGGGGSAAPSGADSTTVTPDTSSPFSNPLVLGGLAVLALLVLRGKR